MECKMPNGWRKSTLIQIFKNKRGTKNYGNYKGIKLIGHTMKPWEKAIEPRFESSVSVI